jgi:hypothetical protein
MADIENSAVATPVYVPWATFISALDNLRTHGIPASGRIDKSLWDTQSGAIQGQLLIAFRFLGLIDDKNKVLPTLPTLVEAEGPARKPLLKAIVEEKYKSVISLGLASISQGQLDDAFKLMNVSGSTRERAVRFFIKACQELGIPISSRVAQKTRAAGSQPRRPRRQNTQREQTDGVGSAVSTANPVQGSWETKLLEKFPSFDPNWPDDLKAKWFSGFDRLMKAKPHTEGV